MRSANGPFEAFSRGAGRFVAAAMGVTTNLKRRCGDVGDRRDRRSGIKSNQVVKRWMCGMERWNWRRRGKLMMLLGWGKRRRELRPLASSRLAGLPAESYRRTENEPSRVTCKYT